MAKLPAIQFYPGDWKKDAGVQALDYEHRGIWFELLLVMHESEDRGKLLLNGKAMPQEVIARILGLDNQKTTNAISKFLDYGVASIDEETGALYSRRMVKDEKLRQVRKSCGNMGGNPNLVKQKPTTRVKQNPTPSTSTSVSSSTSISPLPPKGVQEETENGKTISAWTELSEFLKERFHLTIVDHRGEKTLMADCNAFRTLGAGTKEILEKERQYRERYPGMAVTIKALLTHWNALAVPVAPKRAPLPPSHMRELN